MERGGEVQVAVRTPDAKLAGELRRDLPSLAARLEQTGLRAESWHSQSNGSRSGAGADQGGERDANSRNNQGSGQRQEDKRQAQPFDQPHSGKQKGKDFAWFMSSLG
jgi:hypothetical protein